ncbi:unnamed protein product, partial [Ranitomeya imitator]
MPNMMAPQVPYYYDYDVDQSVAQQQPNSHVQTGFHILTQPDLHHFEFVPQQQQQNQQEIIPAPTFDSYQTEPTEPGPLDCREEQYPCTRLYSVHKPCKQCLNGICLYSLRRMYVINKEICIRTVCAHEELLRADLCRDKFPAAGVVASSGLCHSVGSSVHQELRRLLEEDVPPREAGRGAPSPHQCDYWTGGWRHYIPHMLLYCATVGARWAHGLLPSTLHCAPVFLWTLLGTGFSGSQGSGQSPVVTVYCMSSRCSVLAGSTSSGRRPPPAML